MSFSKVAVFAVSLITAASIAAPQSGSSTISGFVKIDVRAEAYNLLNRANFNIPGATLGAADFGVVSSARSPRTVQLGLRIGF